ncbi:MAG: 2'-5' RNA ligase family protein [Pseudonocardiaceae bacterium]
MLDLVPPDGLHLTLQKVGFTDEIDSSQLQAAANTTAQRCTGLASFVLHIGWLAGSQGAIRFTALPVKTVVRVRHVVLEALGDCGPTTNQPAESTAFWPHVSIAYCNKATPATPAIERVAPLRSLAPAKVHVHTLDLVELQRDGKKYRWNKIAQVELEQ